MANVQDHTGYTVLLQSNLEARPISVSHSVFTVSATKYLLAVITMDAKHLDMHMFTYDTLICITEVHRLVTQVQLFLTTATVN